MPHHISLGARLQTCASFVPDGAALADVGTDHGYLPIYLLQTGRIRSAVAADIGKGPLQSAALNAEKYGVELHTILSDGFEKIEPGSFDTAVLAGMGGELMMRILSKAEFLKSSDIRLILQPMTSIHDLRRFLIENGFTLEQEKAVEEDGKIYTVLCVSYSGIGRECGALEAYMGRLEPEDAFSEKYAGKVLSRLDKELLGARHRKDTGKEAELLSVMEKIRQTYLEKDGKQ